MNGLKLLNTGTGNTIQTESANTHLDRAGDRTAIQMESADTNLTGTTTREAEDCALGTPASAPQNDPVLALTDVNVSLGDNHVLQDVTFNVKPGELVGLLGPNGAGKTTLIRTILGLLRPTSGHIRIGGSTRPRAGAEGGIGYVPQKQEARWDYPITVEEVVLSSLRPRLLARASQWRATYEALDAVGMKGYRARPISALSGGQRQRVLIARALASKPSLLLLDEPFTGLDEPNQEALSKLAMNLTKSGISVIMSTHDLVQATGMCDRFILLNRSIRAVGPLEELAEAELWASTYEVTTDSALVQAVSSLTGHAHGVLPELRAGLRAGAQSEVQPGVQPEVQPSVRASESCRGGAGSGIEVAV